MEGKAQVDGDAQSLAAGQLRGAAGEPVDPQAARAVVVGIVVDSLGGGVDAVGRSGPLEPVAGALGKAGIAAGGIAVVDGVERLLGTAGDIAHAAADLDCIGADGGAGGGAHVGEGHHGAVFAGLEREVPQVNPCAGAHALVYGEVARAGGGEHGIVGVGGGVGQGRVAHVYGVCTVGGDIGAPLGMRGTVGSGHCGHAARVALAEGIAAVAQLGAVPAGAMGAGVGPALAAVVLDKARGGLGVGVDYHLDGRGVALAGTHHVGSGIAQHGHQEGHHVALRVEVFDGLEDTGALPLPAVELGLVVPAVALPHGYVGPVETFGGGGGLVVGHKWQALRGAAQLLGRE